MIAEPLMRTTGKLMALRCEVLYNDRGALCEQLEASIPTPSSYRAETEEASELLTGKRDGRP